MTNTGIYGPGTEAAHRLLAAECSLAKLSFRRADVPAVRRFAAVFGTRAGMGPARLADFVLAVSEAAACAICHGPCTARLRLCTIGARVIGEIRADGMLLAHGPRAAEQGDAEALRRRLLQRICDHASVEARPYGVTVQFSIAIA